MLFLPYITEMTGPLSRDSIAKEYFFWMCYYPKIHHSHVSYIHNHFIIHTILSWYTPNGSCFYEISL
jgi:hypothetical protein